MGGIETWIAQLQEEGHLTADEAGTMSDWQNAFESLFEEVESPERAGARANLTRACELIAWEEWNELRAHLRQV